MIEKLYYGKFEFVALTFNGRCEIRHKSEKGLRVCLMAATAWRTLFATELERAQLLQKILTYYFY